MPNSSINTWYIICEFATFSFFWWKYDKWWIALIAMILAPLIVGMLNGIWRARTKQYSQYPSMFVIWGILLLAIFISNAL